MDAPRRNQLTIVSEPTRFERHRQAVADRGALELAADLAKQAKEKIARAESLLNTAAASDVDKRLALVEDAINTLRAAHGLAGEVLAEFKPPPGR